MDVHPDLEQGLVTPPTSQLQQHPLHYDPAMYNATAPSTPSTHSWRHPKLTGYRILVIALTASFGISKAVLSYEGLSIIPTTLDWMFGVLGVLGLYWLGLYEKTSPNALPWLFEKDYLCLFAKQSSAT